MAGDSTATVRVRRWPDGETVDDCVAVEEPLEIRLGWGPLADRRQQSVAITMRTPGNDEELALGFLFSEGILASGDQVRSVGPCGESGDQAVRVELTERSEVDLGRLQRHFYTTSSCGVCGKQSIAALRVSTRHRPADAPYTIAGPALTALPDRLRDRQLAFAQTGSIHAAASFDPAGELIRAFEDVGRHNAVDKLVGDALQRHALPLSGVGILVSGRASFELVQKAAMAGCPVLAAVGGPSSLAVEAAVEFGITLVGFLRAGRFNVYSRPDRITG